jgi:hypothetical protein
VRRQRRRVELAVGGDAVNAALGAVIVAPSGKNSVFRSPCRPRLVGIVEIVGLSGISK